VEAYNDISDVMLMKRYYGAVSHNNYIGTVALILRREDAVLFGLKVGVCSRRRRETMRLSASSQTLDIAL